MDTIEEKNKITFQDFENLGYALKKMQDAFEKGYNKEEDKRIEKLDIREEKNIKNNWKYVLYGKEHKYNISTPQKIMGDKINEIIDIVNKME